MNIYHWALYSILILSVFSCKKFLKVTPRTESPEEVKYSTESGFKDVLTGVYIQIKDNSLYGNELVFGTLEHLLSSWDTSEGSVEIALNRHDYSSDAVISRFDKIHFKMYAAIANLNALLSNIDERRGVFTSEAIYRLIKGETLGLRAYLHLDILRIYGPVPSKRNAAPILSYVKTVSKDPHPKIGFDAYVEALLNDLHVAAELLSDIDPITKYSLMQLRNPGQNTGFNPADDFFSHRMLRMNVYAVKALMARVYLWNGNTEQAGKVARELVNVKNADGTAKFRLGTDTDMVNNDFALINEHIFSLFDHNLDRKFEDNFANGILKKGNIPDLIQKQLYADIKQDIRGAHLWEMRMVSNTTRFNTLKKYDVQPYGGRVVDEITADEVELKQIPMVRISELYLLLAECAEASEAQQYWDRYLNSRGQPNKQLPLGMPARKEEIMKEFRREFFGEGQAFYTYKRMDVAANKILFKASNSAVEYRIPEPLKEKEQIKRTIGYEENN